MNRFFIFAIAPLSIIACNKNPREVNTVPLKVDRSSLTLDNEVGKIDSFSIQYDRLWTLTITPSASTWLKPNISSGIGNTKVFLAVQKLIPMVAKVKLK